MEATFERLTEIVKQDLGVKTRLGPTKTRIIKAIGLVEKMSFVKPQTDEQDTIMRKEI
jgi:hypothetical protein